mmetsp:Transcript_33409/g.74928  ORF Transcript_33409/g.74928 Transcript_33409/m.74928 type:complete len:215 (-) Transcript_33409:220-864(-)
MTSLLDQVIGFFGDALSNHFGEHEDAKKAYQEEKERADRLEKLLVDKERSMEVFLRSQSSGRRLTRTDSSSQLSRSSAKTSSWATASSFRSSASSLGVEKASDAQPEPPKHEARFHAAHQEMNSLKSSLHESFKIARTISSRSDKLVSSSSDPSERVTTVVEPIGVHAAIYDAKSEAFNQAKESQKLNRKIGSTADNLLKASLSSVKLHRESST